MVKKVKKTSKQKKELLRKLKAQIEGTAEVTTTTTTSSPLPAEQKVLSSEPVSKSSPTKNSPAARSRSEDCSTPSSDEDEEQDRPPNAAGAATHDEDPRLPVKSDASADPTGDEDPTTGSTASLGEGDDGDEAPASATFASLGLCPELCEAVDLLGWTSPTPIQKMSLPHAFSGKDVIALAETGSGKTGAFALPIVQSLLNDPKKPRFYAVALSPTRELCVQIADQFKALGSGIGLLVTCLLGGADMVAQTQQLANRPHIVVASPGRLVDHMENTKGFHIKAIQYLVLDEADRLLSEDFEECLEKISRCGNPLCRKTFLFSATMTSKVSKLQKACLKNPVKIEVSSKYDTAAGLLQHYCFQPLKWKMCWLVAVVAHFSKYSSIIFADTCREVQRAAAVLRELGFSAIALHGQMSQPHRLGALNSFKAGQKTILVATDVASRGLDIPAVDVVINYDIPKNSKDYVHRVGRTARAGRCGRAITIFSQYDVECFQRIEAALGKKLDELPEISEEVGKSYYSRVAEACRKVDLEEREGGAQAGRNEVKKFMNKKLSQNGRAGGKKGGGKKGGGKRGRK